MNGKKILIIMTLLLIVSLVVACEQKESVTVNESNTSNSMELTYTDSFHVETLADGSKVVTDGSQQKLLLVQRGESIPAGYDGVTVVYLPIEKTVITAEHQGSLLRPSGALETVIGYTQNINDWYFDELIEGIESGRVTFLGNGNSPDFEKLQELSPDIVILATGLETVGDKLKELGIPYLIEASDWEAHPMGRMEWIKLFSTFYNKEEAVTAYFENAEQQIANITAKVSGLDQPKIMWGFLFNGKAFVPYGGSYVGEHIKLAGGDYVFSDLGPDKPHTATITVEEFYVRSQIADFYISSGPPAYNTSTQDIIDRGLPVMKDMKSIVEDTVWCYQPWYYQVVDETPQLVEELQAIMYPEMYPDYTEFKYYYKVPKKD